MKTQILNGSIDNIIFENKDTGYMVCRLENKVDGHTIICVGNMSGLISGENVELEGYYEKHGKYGEQFKVINYKKMIPSSKDGIEKYLASGIIRGIGIKTAIRIVERFGEDTFDVIENDYMKLAEIKGITKIRAKEINIAFREQRAIRDTILQLSKYDISTNIAIKIHERYKEDSVKTVKKNPYCLINNIKGIGFKIADGIARKIGIDVNDINRVSAGIKYVLGEASMNGHTYLPFDLLKKRTEEFLCVDENLIDNAILELQIKKQIFIETINDEKAVYLDILFWSENIVAMKIKELNYKNEKIDAKLIDKQIKELERENEITLALKQKEAIYEVLKNGVSVITGGPGTGKTTIINFIIKILEKEGNAISLASPTGRAAKRMTEATGKEAKTIHRLLEVMVNSDDDEYQKFARCETNPIEADVIIIDEASMLDIYIASSLLRALMKGTKVVWVGDHNQLPSVGPGNFLKDLIISNFVSVVELTEIYRQSSDSHIALNAHKINKGEYPELLEKSKDFFFIKRNSTDGILNTMLELIENRLPAKLNCSANDIQILTPMRKGELGVENINRIFQNVMNPARKGKEQKEMGKRIFRVNDRVMQIRNNYNIEWQKNDEYGQGVFNGEQGIITSINEVEGSIKILFDDDKVVNYTTSGMEDIEHAYGITIHKSQGSEYPVVIIPLLGGPEMLMTRNLLYTAITRAKKMIILIGTIETMINMINNNRIIERYSGLAKKLSDIN